MKREEKQLIIGSLTECLQQYPHFYLVDSTGLNAEEASSLRRLCFEQQVKLVVVKNTFFKIDLETLGNEEANSLGSALTGTTAVLLSDVGSAPAKIIKEFSRASKKVTLKAAFVEENAYIGAENLDALVAIKSHDELIADVVALLQSPLRNIISALTSREESSEEIAETPSENEQ